MELSSSVQETVYGLGALCSLYVVVLLIKYGVGERFSLTGRRVAWALAVFTTGSAVKNLWMWISFVLVSDGYDTSWMRLLPILEVGAVINAVGAFYVVCVLAGVGTAWRAWLAILVLLGVFLVVF